MNKKLQVFVSSTYIDLKEERQAAVEAILESGHIPAGMELFTAGNESQLQTIYKWIKESDVYMLILGGRYGSVDISSQKSYTQLEYEYAIKNNIPVFSIILSNKFITSKIINNGIDNVQEQIYVSQYQEFKKMVMAKMSKIVDDTKDIKLAIMSSLMDFSKMTNLIGWVRSNDSTINSNLYKEKNELLQTIDNLNRIIKKSNNKKK